MICVVHLKAKKDFEQRADEMAKLLEYVIKYNVEKTFIVGDFNEEKEEVKEIINRKDKFEEYKKYVEDKFEQETGYNAL